MKLRGWPVLAAGAILMLVGAWRLLDAGSTSPAAAGVLLGAGLVTFGVWLLSEFRD